MMAVNGVAGRRKLTDQMTLALSRRINNEADLRNLATNGLGVRDYIIDRHLHNERHDISEAALKVIGDWKKSRENAYVAYDNLREALDRAGMKMIKTEVLGRSN